MNEPTLHKPLRLWPGIVIVAVQWLARYGLPAFIPPQVRGAAAVGIDALFIETHPDPDSALSDGSNMVPLDRMRALLEMTLAIHATHGATSK